MKDDDIDITKIDHQHASDLASTYIDSLAGGDPALLIKASVVAFIATSTLDGIRTLPFDIPEGCSATCLGKVVASLSASTAKSIENSRSKGFAADALFELGMSMIVTASKWRKESDAEVEHLEETN